jgi:AmmeMemoRadiSam system protein A
MTLPELAKISVETYVKQEKIIPSSNNLPKEFLKKRAGVFVTIENQGHLRGCIGTYLPTQKNIAQELIQNAIGAATEDYRFGAILKEELPYLSYTVYILSKPEKVKNIKALNPKKFGIILKTHGLPPKCGLLLPDLEDVDTVEQQIEICCQKGGIDKEKEKFVIFRFEVQKYEDKQ